MTNLPDSVWLEIGPARRKENIDMAGLPTTWGVPALAQAAVPADAPVVERMRAAGAIPIAPHQSARYGVRLHTNSSLHGLTRNPWHPGCTAGGSTGFVIGMDNTPIIA